MKNMLKNTMKGIAAAVLALAVILSVQMGLAGVLGFRTAEVLGKTAVTALFLYSVIRLGRRERQAA